MLNAAIVGLGWWGRYIVNSLTASEKISIIRAVDLNLEAAEPFAEDHGLTISNDLQDALTDAAIDMVILATPHSLHEGQIIQVAGAGKHVFCEKPLCLTADSAKRAIDACQAAGVQLGVGHERRFEPAMLEIERMVKAGDLGLILHAEANFSHDKLAKISADDWRASSKDAPGAGMTGTGIHLSDAYLNMLGPVSEVYAQTAKRVLPMEDGDVTSVQLRMTSGATAYFSAVLATPLYIRFQVFGVDAWVEARNPTHPDTPGDTFLTVCRAGAEPQTRTFAWADAVRANFENFADAINDDGDYAFTTQQKLHNIEIFEAICRSAASNQPVKLN